MGLLSALGKIGSLALDFIPGGGAAKTGVKVAKALAKGASAAGDIGSVVGKQQQGAAQGQISQAQLNQGQDRNAIDLYQAQQGAQNTAAQTDLQRKSFESSNRSKSALDALIGSLLGGGVTPTSLEGGKASGGLLRSLNGNPEALAAMKALGAQGSAAQVNPLSFAGGQMVGAPMLTPVPQVDKGGLMSTLAQIGQIAGAASPYLSAAGGDPGRAPAKQGAVDVMGSMPGGAVVPRTGTPTLPTTDITEILKRLQGGG